MATPLPLGKLRPALLQDLLTQHAVPDPRVVVGPRIGEDAAVLDMGDRYLVAAGIPTPRADHAQAAARLALAMRERPAVLPAARDLRIRVGSTPGRSWPA